MRILMLAPQPFFRPRGTPFSVLHRIRALLKLGHQVDLVTYPFGNDVALEGLRIFRSARPMGVRDVVIGPSLAKLALDVPLFRLATRLGRENSYDLLHTHEEAGLFGAVYARRLGLPHLYDMHSSLPQQFENFGRFNWPGIPAAFRRIETYTLNHSEAVIAICPELADHVQAAGYRGPLEMIENCLDVDPPADLDQRTAAVRARLGLEGRRVIVYTGTLEAYQGVELLLEAFRILRLSVPDTCLVIVGGALPRSERLRGAAEALGVGSSVHFVPAVPAEEVFAYLQLATTLVTCRLRGTNTPLKLYQYLRAGRPIVATAIRSHTQVLDEEVAELVAVDAAAIAQGLARVLHDPARARTLARNARLRAESEYSEQAYMTKLSRILAKLPAAPRPPHDRPRELWPADGAPHSEPAPTGPRGKL
jgi:glycosyltransferase involved in cell wall biosynthesis